MALAIDITDGRGLSNEARRELLLVLVLRLEFWLKTTLSKLYNKSTRV